MRIILVGCGNVGSRHLQAIAKLGFSISVDVVEPNLDAQSVAKMRLNEISYDRDKMDLQWHSSLDNLSKHSDLVIVATTSTGRAGVINKLLRNGHSRFLIEKMVCQSAREYIDLLSEFKVSNAKGWVNTPRRYYDSYQWIRKQFMDKDIARLSVISGDMGLGSNAIHFIDLFLWLCNGGTITLDGSLLHNELLANKRGKDFVEFAGSIVGSTNNSSVLTITFLPHGQYPLVINIVGNDLHFVADETNEMIWQLGSKNSTNPWPFKNEYLSDLGTRIITDILNRDNCLLPTLTDSFNQHSELFRVFNAQIQKLTNRTPELCPVT